MDAHQRAWPRMWLMTDERMGDRLWHAIGRLPDGGGIVLRHYSLAPASRAELAKRVAAIADERRLILSIAGDAGLARSAGARLVHNPPSPQRDLPFSRSAHSIEEAEAARSAGAALVFVSPVFGTRSHPGQEPLGPEWAAAIARAAVVPAIALGGMDARSFTQLAREGFYGWAAIDAWLQVRT